jgi:hypothetical protein
MRKYERRTHLNVAILDIVINHVKGLRAMYEVRLANLNKISPLLRRYLAYGPQGNLKHFKRMQDNPLDYRNGKAPSQTEEHPEEANDKEQFPNIDDELPKYLFDNHYFKVLRQNPVNLPQLLSTPYDTHYTVNAKYLREKYKDYADAEGTILAVLLLKVSYGRRVKSYVLLKGILLEAKAESMHTVHVRINPIQP